MIVIGVIKNEPALLFDCHVSSWLFVMLILMYAFIKLVFFDCQVDFDVDNVKRHELINFYRV